MSGMGSCEVDMDRQLDEDAESSITMCIPQVAVELIPRIGQQFDSLDDVASFYNAYAKAASFSVRISTTRKSPKTDVVKRKEYVCFKIGPPVQLVESGTKRWRGSIGESCKAKIAVIWRFGKYIISIFNEEHSHYLSSAHESHLLRSHRDVSDVAKLLKQQMDIVNIPKAKQYGLLEVQSGGLENIGFTKKDFYNYDRDLRAVLKGHDGERLYDYMKLQETRNPAFSFKIEADEDNKITRCFWCDSVSRRLYKYFGDVIVFDTTYQTNRYGLIFAPIIGVNNHGQTIILVCAFLNHETVEDFVWLFTRFLEVMSGGAPTMIITDQDPAMAKALPLVMPTTVHRYCIWHIMFKFSEKLDVNKYTPHAKDFKDCILKSESPEEFDSEWHRLIGLSELGDNKWLQELFEIRSKWIPAYLNHLFSANMSSSQRAESGHSFFKKFVSANNSLLDFMIRFDRGLAHQRHEELIADHKDKVEKPKLRLPHHFLVQMAEFYTREIYYKFEEQLFFSFNYILELIKDDGGSCVYQIHRKKDESKKNDEKRRIRHIVVDKSVDHVSCSCKKFESSGILCRHVLAYFNKFEDYDVIPEKYILRRWTKSAKLGVVEDESGIQIIDDSSFVVMRSKMVQLSLDVVDKAMFNEETRNMFEEALRVVTEKIGNFIIDRKKGQSSINSACEASSVHGSCTFASNYKEPDIARYKGCGTRFKSGKENALKKSKMQKERRCHGCNQVGQSHDKRNCPAILNVLLEVCTSNANIEEGDFIPTE